MAAAKIQRDVIDLRAHPEFARLQRVALTIALPVAKAHPEPEVGGRWYVVHTNVKCETRAESGLIDRGFGVYLPKYLQEMVARRVTKRQLVRRILFPRYLFVRAADGSWPRICATDGVAEILRGEHGQPLSVKDQVIDALMEKQAVGALDQTDNAKRKRGELAPKLVAGQRVRIVEGPFAAFFATVVVVLGNRDARVLIDVFGGETPATMALASLENLR